MLHCSSVCSLLLLLRDDVKPRLVFLHGTEMGKGVGKLERFSEIHSGGLIANCGSDWSGVCEMRYVSVCMVQCVGWSRFPGSWEFWLSFLVRYPKCIRWSEGSEGEGRVYSATVCVPRCCCCASVLLN